MSITSEQLKEIFAKVITEVENRDVINLSKEEKINLANNPNTPPKTLELLATDENCNVRWCVAQNPNTSPKTLEKLATDENSYVRYWAAQNPNYQKTIQITVKEANALKEFLNSTKSEELKSLASKL
jgi:hypothetical protein